MSTVRRLVFTGKGWSVEKFAVTETPADRVPVVVESVLLPPGVKDAGLWVGHDARAPATRYTGWGPLTDLVSSPVEHLLPLSDETAIEAVLSLPVCAIAKALEQLMPVTNIAVVGDGLLGSLVARYMAGRAILQPAEEGAELDLVVDTSGELSRWNHALGALRAEGTLLLLVPPWSTPFTFNFYPYVHRRSLRVVAQRWHRPPPALDISLRGSLRSLISEIVKEGRWVRSLDLRESNEESLVWRSLDWMREN
jgi:threonine dehydrogenase-like Zn-dependent dehydrogenase